MGVGSKIPKRPDREDISLWLQHSGGLNRAESERLIDVCGKLGKFVNSLDQKLEKQGQAGAASPISWGLGSLGLGTLGSFLANMGRLGFIAILASGMVSAALLAAALRRHQHADIGAVRDYISEESIVQELERQAKTLQRLAARKGKGKQQELSILESQFAPSAPSNVPDT